MIYFKIVRIKVTKRVEYSMLLIPKGSVNNKTDAWVNTNMNINNELEIEVSSQDHII